VATEADRIFEALSDKFTGEVNAKEFIDKIFFGENSEYLNDFHNKFEKELFNPVKNRLGVVFKMIQKRVDSITPDVVDRINEPFDDLKTFSNEVKNKTDDWISKLDEKYKKILEIDNNSVSNNQKKTKSNEDLNTTKSVQILPKPIKESIITKETSKTSKVFDIDSQLIEFQDKIKKEYLNPTKNRLDIIFNQIKEKLKGITPELLNLINKPFNDLKSFSSDIKNKTEEWLFKLNEKYKRLLELTSIIEPKEKNSFDISKHFNEFQNQIKKEYLNPIKNRLDVVFNRIQQRLNDITPDIVDTISEPFKDLRNFSNKIKNNTENWLIIINEKYKKLLESEFIIEPKQKNSFDLNNQLIEFQDKIKKEQLNPVKNRLDVVFKMIKKRLDDITPDIVDRINEPFKDLKNFSNEIKNKTEEWLAKLDEKYKKILEADSNISTEVSNKKIPVEVAPVTNTKAIEVLPSSIKEAATNNKEDSKTNKEDSKTVKQQKGFDDKVELVEFDEKTEGFFKSLFNKFKGQEKGKSSTSSEADAKNGFTYGGILADGIQILLAGVAGMVGAFMTDGPLKGTLELIGKGGLRGGLALLSKTMFGSFAKTALKKVPVIGALYSYGLAYQRLNSGDTVGGILDIASGTASLFPGVGTALSLGIDVLQAVLDAKSGGSSAEASSKKLNILSNWGNDLYKTLKKIPIINTFVNVGEGIWEFFSSFASGDINRTKSGLKKMSEFPILGIWPALLGSVLDATELDSQGKINGFDWKKFSDDFSNNIKMTVLSWIPDIGNARSIVAKALGISLPEGEKTNLDDLNAATVAAGKSQREGKPVLKYTEETVKKAEQDYNDKKEAYEKHKKNWGDFGIATDEENELKEQMDDAEKKLQDHKKGLKEKPNETFKYNEEDLKKAKEDYDLKAKTTVDMMNKWGIDSKEYVDAEKERLSSETLYRSLINQKKKQSKNSTYYSNDDYQSDIKDFSKKQLPDNNAQGSIKIEDEVFSIKDNKGTKYVPHKDDTLVVSKPDGALNKTLIEIKQVMMNVNSGIKELVKKEEKISKTEDKIFNITNQMNSSMSGNSRDPIYSIRNEWWARTNRGIIV